MPWWDDARCSIFETIRVQEGRPVAMQAHWKRLIDAQKLLLRKLPSRTLEDSVRQAARRLPSGEGGVRVGVTTSGQTVSESILPRGRRWSVPLKQGVSVATAVGPGGSFHSQWPQIKHGDRLPGVLAWGQLYPQRIFEQIWCNAQGHVSEGTFSYIFIWRKGVLVTPPVSAGVLPGIVRENLLGLARRLKIPAAEQLFTRHELFTAEEAFLTNSLIGIVPVRQVDCRRIGAVCPGETTRKLQRAYRKLIPRFKKGSSL
ncbi:MAG: aminotransferase class IV family protein [Candidatus Omnitrophica bacterium]|nr:aminotransferase class IV family protein [Candidatus Omnitrophota bacterium]